MVIKQRKEGNADKKDNKENKTSSEGFRFDFMISGVHSLWEQVLAGGEEGEIEREMGAPHSSLPSSTPG